MSHSDLSGRLVVSAGNKQMTGYSWPARLADTQPLKAHPAAADAARDGRLQPVKAGVASTAWTAAGAAVVVGATVVVVVEVDVVVAVGVNRRPTRRSAPPETQGRRRKCGCHCGSRASRFGLAWSRSDRIGSVRPQSAPMAGSSHATPSSSAAVSSSTAATSAPSGTTDTRAYLAQLSIDDHPHTLSDYSRDAWPLWADIDGDGCDARQQALRAASSTSAQVVSPCKVVSGSWVSAYDGFTTTNPGDLDIDHVVPLANAHISGGWAWSTDQRRQYANDQQDLWVVSASSNRSKGDSSPDEWRPPQRGVWCTYAQRWTGIKVRWGLTATTPERDALGQMLDTCPPGTMLSLSPTPTTTPATSPPTTAAPAPPGGASTYYANCAAARAAGVAPLHRSDPGYRSGLDGDGDGIACE
jgi:hypothetical protein